MHSEVLVLSNGFYIRLIEHTDLYRIHVTGDFFNFFFHLFCKFRAKFYL